MKKLFFLVLVVFSISTGNLTAQEKEGFDLGLTNEEFFKQSDFIVEAQAVTWDGHGINRSYDINGNYNPEDIYTEYLFRVNVIYKSVDNLIKQSDTIVIVSDRGSIQKIKSTSGEWTFWETIEKPRNGTPVYVNGSDKFILFLKKTDLPINPNEKNNYFHCQFLRESYFARLKFELGWDKSSGLNNLSFDNKYDLYKYMEQFEDLNLPLSNPEQMKWELRYDFKSYHKYLEERLGIKKTKERNDSILNYMLEHEKQLVQSVKKKSTE